MWSKAYGNLFTGRITKLFFNFRCMSVAGHAIGLHTFIDLTKQVRRLCSSSGTGGTGFCIDNQRIGINQPLLHQRVRRQNGTGCVAAGICNQTGFFRHQLPVNFTKTIHCFLNELWTLVFNFVPLFISGNILDSIIRTKIHNLNFT